MRRHNQLDLVIEGQDVGPVRFGMATGEASVAPNRSKLLGDIKKAEDRSGPPEKWTDDQGLVIWASVETVALLGLAMHNVLNDTTYSGVAELNPKSDIYAEHKARRDIAFTAFVTLSELSREEGFTLKSLMEQQTSLWRNSRQPSTVNL